MSRSKNKKEEISIKEKISDFFYSDTPTATITKFLLAGVALGSFVFIGAAVPGILKVMDSFGGSGGGYAGKRPQKYSREQVRSTFYRLKKRKLIKIIQTKDGKTSVKLTNQGKKRIREFVFDAITITKPDKWDGLWRVVIFDIPIEHNKARAALRRKIKELGFKQLQESAWIFPYECEDEILFVAKIFEVEKYVEIMTVQRLLHERGIKKLFNKKEAAF